MSNLCKLMFIGFVASIIIVIFRMPIYLAKYPISAKTITLTPHDKSKYSAKAIAQIERDLSQISIGSLSLQAISNDGKSRYIQLGESSLDKFLAKLGLPSFLPKFVFGQDQGIKLNIETNQSMDSLKREIHTLSQKTGVPVYVADRINAHMSSHSFLDSPFVFDNILQQGVHIPSKEGITLNVLQVSVPLEWGAQQLTVELFSYFDHFEKGIAQKTFSKVIKIEVTADDYLSNLITENWLWVCASIWVVTTLWLVTWLFLKKANLTLLAFISRGRMG